ncbi:hypothetical protein FA13DRAFT_69153 [Coprinellus micaceus]|uniref:DUF6534 domain-containing protein n=1 Tax=Coprinellus micaceus TaxID=71717 RepID=A0A4Y7TIZ3_COPMI|nr:hypothetical protein FA13DRAFT_69153 [Coprinellus micaceus]
MGCSPVNTYLFGVLSCQYTRYHNKNFNDHWRVKGTVFFLFVLDTFQSILMVYLCWIFLVANFDNPWIFGVPQWPCAFIPIGTAVTASITHAFLGARMFGMLQDKFLFVLVLGMSLAEFGAGMAFGIRMWMLKDAHLESQTLKPFLIPWLAFQMSIDVFMSGFMSIFFYRHRTGYARTDRVINRLIRGCIQTGAFSAMLAICGLVAFLVRPHTIFYTMFMIPIGRTYTTTLMDTLNVRAELKERLMKDIDPNEEAESIVAWPRQIATREATPEGGSDHRLSAIAPRTGTSYPTFANTTTVHSTEELGSPLKTQFGGEGSEVASLDTLSRTRSTV